jgi:environmental stress-induced protein Ves
MTALILTPLPPEGFGRTPWKNGGGVTIDIAAAYLPGAVVGGWQGMLWRFGRTGITIGAPFSDLSGYERMQVVIEGSGLVLETPDGEIDVRRPFRPVRYDGGTPIVSRLENGPVEVVNLMADRRRCEIDLAVATANEALALSPGTHIVYAPGQSVSGQAGDGPIAIDSGHALRIDAGSDFRLALAAGQAVVASVRLRSTAA